LSRSKWQRLFTEPLGFSADKELLVRSLGGFSADLEPASEEIITEDKVISKERELLATLTNSWKNICDTKLHLGLL
jgi:hypothetical protein